MIIRYLLITVVYLLLFNKWYSLNILWLITIKYLISF